jgi:hypothetical protein
METFRWGNGKGQCESSLFLKKIEKPKQKKRRNVSVCGLPFREMCVSGVGEEKRERRRRRRLVERIRAENSKICGI